MNYAKTLTTPQLLNYIDELKKAYYFGTPKISDEEYDDIVDLLPEGVKPKTGAQVPSSFKDKTRLPYWMGSLDKAKSGSGIIERFTRRKECGYVVSDKLDGLSGLLVVGAGDDIALYTRGEGDEGRNISYLLKYMNVPALAEGAYRGELIISKKNFARYQKHAPAAKNARTTAVGLVNSKTPNKRDLGMIDFVAYEMITPGNPQLLPSKQLKALSSKGAGVWYTKLPLLTDATLEEITLERIKTSDYDIDGLVVTQDLPYERADGVDPDYSIAYKIIKSGIETTVNSVTWKISKDGYLKPTVHYNPIIISGNTFKKATAHNAAFVWENKLGAGSVICVTRSNEVIPYVTKVIKGTTADMPEVDWEWNETRKDAVTVDATADEHLQTVVYFFKEIGCQFFGEKMIERCVKIGYRTVTELLDCTIEDFCEAEGIERKSATRIYNNIREALSGCSEAALMSASNQFGRTMGKKRIQLMVDEHPDWDQQTPSREQLLKIEGYQAKTADAVLEGIGKFKKFLAELPPPYNRIEHYRRAAPKRDPAAPGPMDGQKIVCTGFRSRELEAWIEKNGGEVVSAVSKKTTLLLTKDATDSTKRQKAKQLGIPIELVKDFCTQHKIQV